MLQPACMGRHTPARSGPADVSHLVLCRREAPQGLWLLQTDFRVRDQAVISRAVAGLSPCVFGKGTGRVHAGASPCG